MKLITCVWLLLCLTVSTGKVHAQGVGSSGEIAGSISDPSGARIPQATVIATETDRGIEHVTETDTNGKYRLVGLPPAVYDLTVRIAGFQTAIRKGLVLTVGATLVADSSLKLSPVGEVVE